MTVISHCFQSQRMKKGRNENQQLSALIYISPYLTFDSDYTLLLGVLRRLKDWHNANVTIFDLDLSPQTEFLQKFLSATVCCHDNVEREDGINGDVLWRGKMSICDKIVSTPEPRYIQLCIENHAIRY